MVTPTPVSCVPLFALLVMGAACEGSETVRPGETVPAAIAAVGGDRESGPAGMPLGRSLVARVTNASGAVLPGVLVDWEVTAGDGRLAAPVSETDTAGRAAMTYRMGTAVGTTDTVRATVRDTPLYAEFRLPVRTFYAPLEVTHIARTPRLPAPTSAAAPPGAGWPEVGDDVRWVAHVLNRDSAMTIPAVPYVWYENGALVDSGTVDLVPGENLVDLPWTWTFTRHEIAFAVRLREGWASKYDPGLLAAAVPSDALTVGFRVERSIADYVLAVTGMSFARWAHDQITRWNERILAVATYPTITPSGVRDRLRLDTVVVVPDGGPFPGWMAADVDWNFYERADHSAFLDVGSPNVEDQTIVLHELLHDRGLTDLYAYRVRHAPGTPNGSEVGILEGDSLVAGTPVMPLNPTGEFVYSPPFNGLMGSQYALEVAALTEHSVYGLNRRAGRRTPYAVDQFGNVLNLFRGHGYENRIPAETALHLVDSLGQPLAGAEVDVFPDWGFGSYTDVYRAYPDLVLQADANGVVLLPASILDGTPTITHPKSWTLILRVRSGGLRDYVFLPGYHLNLLYFRGDVTRGALTLTVELE